MRRKPPVKAKQVVEYDLVMASHKKIGEIVNKKLAEGWELHGGTITDVDGDYAQPMVKYGTPTKATTEARLRDLTPVDGEADE